MFIYQFPHDNNAMPIFEHLEIKGPYVTLYANSGYSCEVKALLSKMDDAMTFVGRYYHEHQFLHIDKLGLEKEHWHIKLNVKDMESALGDLITLIQQYNVEDREVDYKKHKRDGKIRALLFGGLTQTAREHLKNFNTDAPFILQKDKLVKDVMAKYNHYRRMPTLERCEELMSMYYIELHALSNHQENEDINAALLHLKNIKQAFDELRKAPNDLQLLIRIRNLLKLLRVEMLVKLEDSTFSYSSIDLPLSKRIAFVDQFLAARIKEVNPSIWDILKQKLNNAISYVILDSEDELSQETNDSPSESSILLSSNRSYTPFSQIKRKPIESEQPWTLSAIPLMRVRKSA